MQHNHYNLPDPKYPGDTNPGKIMQINMIKKAYPNYQPDNWVLWIVPELIHNYQSVAITGNVTVKKIKGETIELKQCVRTPYPSKFYNQLSLKSGRKRLYGVPIIFDSFEELCEISDIIIDWEIYESWNLPKVADNFDLHIKKISVNYQVSFEKNKENPDYRFFTIMSRDMSDPDYIYKNSETVDAYHDEFDLIIDIYESINIDSWKIENPSINITQNKIEPLAHREKQLTEFEAKKVEQLKNNLPNREKTKELLKNVQLQSEYQLFLHYYQKTETLKAAYMADILPEPSFGFKL